MSSHPSSTCASLVASMWYSCLEMWKNRQPRLDLDIPRFEGKGEEGHDSLFLVPTVLYVTTVL